jgi:hypothetical protein
MLEGDAMGSAPRIQTLAVLSAASMLVAVLIGANLVLAQTPETPPASGTTTSKGSGPVGVGVVAPEPTRPVPEFGFELAIPPGQDGAREEEFYPERTRSIYQPAFVKGAVGTTRTSRTSGVRTGLSGWTAPRVPFDDRESSGGPAFGFTIEWGTPMEPPPEPALPGQR